ncbi:MAG: hypothetical protein QOH25_2904 [Acidobacteriota bacterium]|jgi:hypothetical protein|nr:hypothetical protein [Acidobacteriota bacterium]
MYALKRSPLYSSTLWREGGEFFGAKLIAFIVCRSRQRSTAATESSLGEN